MPRREPELHSALRRRLRGWVACWVFACLVAFTHGAFAAHKVVLVRTKGPKSWPAAEQRLSAELDEVGRSEGLRVIALGARAEPVPDLSRYAREYGAIAVLQVLRQGDRGMIRIWLERPPGQQSGYAHAALSLRNREVVSEAVMPVVELVNGQLQAWQVVVPVVTEDDDLDSTDAETGSTSTPTVEPKPGGASMPPRSIGAPVYGPPVRYHVRSERRHALRLGAGPWFSGAETTPAIQIGLGVRAHWFRLWSLEPEVFVHSLPHRVRAEQGTGQLRILGGRCHWMFEPWSASTVSFGLGPGVGFAFVEREGDALMDTASATTSLISARAHLASALMPFFDVLFVWTASHALSDVRAGAAAQPEARLMDLAVDAMLALDWHFD